MAHVGDKPRRAQARKESAMAWIQVCPGIFALSPNTFTDTAVGAYAALRIILLPACCTMHLDSSSENGKHNNYSMKIHLASNDC